MSNNYGNIRSNLNKSMACDNGAAQSRPTIHVLFSENVLATF